MNTSATRGPRPESPATRMLRRTKWVGECLEFTGSKRNGYGVLTVGSRVDGTRRLMKAHRVAWEAANGRPIPPGLLVLHKCDNPPCVNPEHLFLGTPKDNTRDMVDKGRHKYGHQVGSANGRARLTEADVVEMRRLAALGETAASLALRFRVAKTTASQVVTRKTWRNVA